MHPAGDPAGGHPPALPSSPAALQEQDLAPGAAAGFGAGSGEEAGDPEDTEQLPPTTARSYSRGPTTGTHLPAFDHLLHRVSNQIGVEFQAGERRSHRSALLSPHLSPTCPLPRDRHLLEVPQHVGGREQHGSGVGDVPAHGLGEGVPGALPGWKPQ